MPSCADDEFPRLSTARLVLRAFDGADAGEVGRLAGDFAVADTTLNVPHPYETAMADEWIATHRPGFEAGELANFAVTRIDGGALLGTVGLQIEPGFSRANLGYWIGQPYWNRGYCTEAASAVLAWAFDRLSLHRVYASHFRRNPASGRVLRKLGMLHEGTLRQHTLKWKRYEDLLVYGVLRHEWQRQKTATPAA